MKGNNCLRVNNSKLMKICLPKTSSTFCLLQMSTNAISVSNYTQPILFWFFRQKVHGFSPATKLRTKFAQKREHFAMKRWKKLPSSSANCDFKSCSKIFLGKLIFCKEFKFFRYFFALQLFSNLMVAKYKVDFGTFTRFFFLFVLSQAILHFDET